MLPNQLPSFDAERCVYALATDASCSRCVTACPQAAIVLSDEGLGLDEDACIGCGICASVCPVQAIEIARGEIRIAGHGRDRTAYIACASDKSKSGNAKVSCVQAIGTHDLSMLHHIGVRRLVVHRPCTDCQVGGDHSLNAVCRDFEQLTASRGLEAIRLEWASPEQWREIEQAKSAGRKPGNPSRRMFFATLIPDTATLRSDRIRLDSQDSHKLPGDQPTALHPFVPEINGSRCTGCDACIEICPKHALTFVNADDGKSEYRILAAKCTGCMLCADVCDQQAISVQAMLRQRRHSIALDACQCKACGASFHQPQGSIPEDGLCRICRKTNHAATLFQVIE